MLFYSCVTGNAFLHLISLLHSLVCSKYSVFMSLSSLILEVIVEIKWKYFNWSQNRINHLIPSTIEKKTKVEINVAGRPREELNGVSSPLRWTSPWSNGKLMGFALRCIVKMMWERQVLWWFSILFCVVSEWQFYCHLGSSKATDPLTFAQVGANKAGCKYKI